MTTVDTQLGEARALIQRGCTKHIDARIAAKRERFHASGHATRTNGDGSPFSVKLFGDQHMNSPEFALFSEAQKSVITDCREKAISLFAEMEAGTGFEGTEIGSLLADQLREAGFDAKQIRRALSDGEREQAGLVE